MKPICYAVLALSLATTAGAQAADRPPFRTSPLPGLHAYSYEVIETINGKVQAGYRMKFDLETSAAGATDAIVRSAEQLQGGAWQAVTATDACKSAMRAPAGGLARVRLWPAAEGVSKGLGSGFLDTCAPAGVFFPLTDILNVAVIPASPTFSVGKLRRAGDHAHYDGFDAEYQRNGESLKETTHGGEVSLVSLGSQAVIDWAPATAELDLVENAGGQPVHLKGTEHFAFRVTLDTRTGALIEAHTTYDDLDLVARMANMPEGPGMPQKITRAVAINPR
jgi:hypothetical protein